MLHRGQKTAKGMCKKTQQCDELPKKTNITIIYDVRVPFSFSAPPLGGCRGLWKKEKLHNLR
jgi:hypothetical protein